ncbi:Uridine kinase [Elasticomyces elasticus]|nr:Uridine kinase [Elasticomyces elasticus]
METTVARATDVDQREKAHYSPPWANTSIIGIAGSSGSGKTSLALAIVAELNLPWVVILSMDSFYRPLTPEQSQQAFRNERSETSRKGTCLQKQLECAMPDDDGSKKADIPLYSFEKHARLERTTTIYSPHVLILEGIFALHDPRILELMDLKTLTAISASLEGQVVRDVRDRGRDLEGCIKQWFSFVKPNFHKYVEPQRQVADIIVPRGVENKVAISMVSDRICKTLAQKSRLHQSELKRLGKAVENAPLSKNVMVLEETPQIKGINALLLDTDLPAEDFVFYFDRLVCMLIDK